MVFGNLQLLPVLLRLERVSLSLLLNAAKPVPRSLDCGNKGRDNVSSLPLLNGLVPCRRHRRFRRDRRLG